MQDTNSTASPKFIQATFELSTVYAVWIRGQGWLKTPQGDPFADSNKAVAKGAASFFGSRARVIPFDDAMLDLEATFIESEKTWRDRLAFYIRNSAQRFTHYWQRAFKAREFIERA